MVDLLTASSRTHPTNSLTLSLDARMPCTPRRFDRGHADDGSRRASSWVMWGVAIAFVACKLAAMFLCVWCDTCRGEGAPCVPSRVVFTRVVSTRVVFTRVVFTPNRPHCTLAVLDTTKSRSDHLPPNGQPVPGFLARWDPCGVHRVRRAAVATSTQRLSG